MDAFEQSVSSQPCDLLQRLREVKRPMSDYLT